MKLKILAVDDDPIIRHLVKNVVAYWGYADLTTAESGERAVQVITQESLPFDCMLIDMRMPGVSGGELCSWVRKLSKYKQTPIFIVTALSEKDDIDIAFAAGASDYITKPIAPSDLTSRLNQVRRQVMRSNANVDDNQKLDDSSRIEFHQSILLGGVHGEIEIGAMENYIFKISKSSAANMNAFSFVIKDAAKLHSVCNRNDFLDVLKITGMMMSKCLSNHQFLVSYVGYGAFVGVVQSDVAVDPIWNEIEQRVQDMLRGARVPLPSSASIGIVPYMSFPQQLSMWSGQNVVDILYRLVGDAESRCGDSFLSQYNK
jgi:CheY-like chemotaxis protein